MDRLRLLAREPALLLDAVETALVLLVAFGLSLSGDQQSYIVAAVVAVIGLVKGFATAPFPVAAVTDLARAVLVLAMAFGLNINDNQVAVAVTFLGTLATLVQRLQVTPNNDPVVRAGGAGAGPVSSDAGYALLGTIGAVLVVGGFVLILLDLVVKGFAVSWVVAVLVIAVGVVLLALDRRSL